MIVDACVKCGKFPWQRHHVVYASSDPRHSECKKPNCDYKHCQYEHPEETVVLCAECHEMITRINTHIWLHKGRHVLTCAERKYWWNRFLKGYTVKANKYDDRWSKKMTGLDNLDAEKVREEIRTTHHSFSSSGKDD